MRLILKFWNFISYLGVRYDSDIQYDDYKRQVFFNRSLFFGLIAIIGSVINLTPFIGNYAYLNLINITGILTALYLHEKNRYALAKRVAVYPIYAMGIVVIALIGGDSLYHTGVVTVLAFSWLIFDPKKDLPELILMVLVTFFSYVIAEFNLFNAPDFSQYPHIQSARLVNIVMFTILIIIFINFIRSLNSSFESKLTKGIIEKEDLLNDVLIQTKKLEKERIALEEIIIERTTELQNQKNVLEEQNKEKEILLREIHHRVKNNLQIIVSLLNLQSSKFNDKKVLKAIEETQNRIITMSLVHQRMYQTSNFVTVHMRDYIDLLIANNQALHLPINGAISYLNEAGQDLKVDIEKAIPLGLVINEMITNSYKYAFVEYELPKKVSILLKESDNGRFILKYRDNGHGLPSDFNFEDTKTLGIQLISALVEQIDGKLSYYNDNGAVFEFTF